MDIFRSKKAASNVMSPEQLKKQEVFSFFAERLRTNPEDFVLYDFSMDSRIEGGEHCKLTWGLRTLDGSTYLTVCSKGALIGDKAEKSTVVQCIQQAPNDVPAFVEAFKKVKSSLELKEASLGEARLSDSRTDLLNAMIQKTEVPALQSPRSIALPGRIASDTGSVATLRDQILALPDEEAKVTDSLSAMQYGLRVQKVFGDAVTAFTDQTIAGAESLAEVEKAFGDLMKDLTGSGQAEAGGPVTFASMRGRFNALKQTLDTALAQVLSRSGKISESAELFEACTTALETLVVNGESLCDRAREEKRVWAEDIEDALQSLRMTRTVSGLQGLTVEKALAAERKAVRALRELSTQTFPLLGIQIAAAVTAEAAVSTQALTLKAGAVDRAALSHLGTEGGSLKDLRQALADQFSKAQQEFAGAQESMADARNLVVGQNRRLVEVSKPELT